ncbi:MAG: hypothetical protein EZS28_048853, partial [Streblomastix strix]
MLFDDIGSNADIQRFSSQLSKTITHLVSDSRHSKNTIFFIAQRPTYLFKTAKILTHVICLGVNLGANAIIDGPCRSIANPRIFFSLQTSPLIVGKKYLAFSLQKSRSLTTALNYQGKSSLGFPLIAQEAQSLSPSIE